VNKSLQETESGRNQQRKKNSKKERIQQGQPKLPQIVERERERERERENKRKKHTAPNSRGTTTSLTVSMERSEF
jgi:hypothetical protein